MPKNPKQTAGFSKGVSFTLSRESECRPTHMLSFLETSLSYIVFLVSIYNLQNQKYYNGKYGKNRCVFAAEAVLKLYSTLNQSVSM